MTKKDIEQRGRRIGEAVFMWLFVITAAAGGLHMLDFIRVSDDVQWAVGTGLGAFALLALGFISWKSTK